MHVRMALRRIQHLHIDQELQPREQMRKRTYVTRSTNGQLSRGLKLTYAWFCKVEVIYSSLALSNIA